MPSLENTSASKPSSTRAVDDMDARHAGLAGGGGVDGLGEHLGHECPASVRQHRFEVGDGIWRITWSPTRMPSWVVMNISLMALSASATASATPSELTR